MPIYGYRCKSCGHELEVLQKMSDPPLKTCPKCSGELAKMVYAAGIVYKGSGYYSTDYSKGGAKASDKASANGSEKASESSGESAPAKESVKESTKESAAPKAESKAPETGKSKQKDS
jgi:putative FmdB family regulatory protein